MRVYVGGSSRNQDRTRAMQSVVRDAGHEITFDWTGAGGLVITDGSWPNHPIEGARVATSEVAACTTADLVIILLEEKGGLGMFIEMGAALAADVPVWVVGAPTRDSVFWQHPRVRRMADDGRAQDAIRAA